MSVSQRIIDHGYDAFIKAHKSVFTKVGFPEGAKLGRPSKNEEASVTDISELTIIAAVHEFGAPSRNISERSFMRSSLDENIQGLQAFKKEQYILFVQGKITLQQAMSRIGEWAKAKMQEKIRTGEFTPLTQQTIDRKGSSKPLIDTSLMLNSIQHVEVGLEGAR